MCFGFEMVGLFAVSSFVLFHIYRLGRLLPERAVRPYCLTQLIVFHAEMLGCILLCAASIFVTVQDAERQQ